MNDLPETFHRASLEDIMQGFIFHRDMDIFLCILCGKAFEQGVVYPDGSRYLEAGRAIKVHVEKEHPSLFDSLLNLDKKYTGLTEHTKTLLRLFYMGYNDNDIVTEIGGGSTSTIRNHRFVLREREKQARIFCAIMGLLEKKLAGKHKLITPHHTATMIDDRYAVTEKERDEILNAYFKDGLDGPLASFPKKEKRKIPILAHIAGKFDRERKYSEKQVNDILRDIYSDHVTIRRYLIEYGFMDRNGDGSSYWIKI
jgi:hypothetical protein